MGCDVRTILGILIVLAATSAYAGNSTIRDGGGGGDVASDDLTSECDSIHMLAPDDDDRFVRRMTTYGATVTDIDCVAIGGGTINVTIRDCPASQLFCDAVNSAVTCDSDGESATISDPAIAQGRYLLADVTSPSGTVDSLLVNICWDRQVVE